MRDECITRLVEQGEAPELCATVTSGQPQEQCAAAAGALGGLPACERAPSEVREACLTQAADKISAPVATCPAGLANCLPLPDSLELARCGRLAERDAAAACLAAALAKRPGWQRDSLCEGLDNLWLQDQCLKALGESPEHGATCSKVRDPELRRGCVLTAALGDSGYCRLLNDAAERKSCLVASGLNPLDSTICSWVAGQERATCLAASKRRVQTELARFAR